MKNMKDSWLLGAKIVEVRPMTAQELKAEGWEDCPGRGATVALVLDNGYVLYPSMDEEGNDYGAMFAHDSNGRNNYRVVPPTYPFANRKGGE